MKINLVFIVVLILCVNRLSWADEYEAEFMAGQTSIEGGMHYRHQLTSGFFKIGGSGLHADDDTVEYKWVKLDFTVGSDTLYTGLTCEAGVVGISGNIEENSYSGDVGAIAFTGKVNYVFSESLLPVPLEAFARITYAPESITFSDTERFLDYQIGIGLRIVQYASVFMKYRACDVDMVSNSHHWEMSDNTLQLGVLFRL